MFCQVQESSNAVWICLVLSDCVILHTEAWLFLLWWWKSLGDASLSWGACPLAPFSLIPDQAVENFELFLWCMKTEAWEELSLPWLIFVHFPLYRIVQWPRAPLLILSVLPPPMCPPPVLRSPVDSLQTNSCLPLPKGVHQPQKPAQLVQDRLNARKMEELVDTQGLELVDKPWLPCPSEVMLRCGPHTPLEAPWWDQIPVVHSSNLAINPTSSLPCFTALHPSPASWDPSQINYMQPSPCLRVCF